MSGNEKIKNKIHIEAGKLEIDLSNWLNAVTNLPEVWQQIISDALTNRYGVFTYEYADTLNHEKDGKIKYNVYHKENGSTVNYGLFDTIHEAMAERDLLEKYNWDTEAICESIDMRENGKTIYLGCEIYE